MRFIFILLSLAYTYTSIAQPISTKRGLANVLTTDYEMSATKNKVIWWYNWAQEPGALVTSTYQSNGYEFAPMVWNGNFDSTTLSNRITNDAGYLLGFNEPNFTDQAHMTAQEAADLWPTLEGIANANGLKIVSPAVNWCGSCTSGYDNDPLDWLDDFMAKCTNCQVDYIAMHWYACTGDALINDINRYKKYGKPIWVTEFACWDDSFNPDLNAQKNYLIESVDILETDPDVFRYSWFAPVSEGTFPYLALFTGDANNPLTELGDIYNRMPVHDTSYYFQAPLRLEAEEYSIASGIRLELCTDTIGMANVAYTDAGDYLEYNIEVAEQNDYTIYFRIASPSGSGSFDFMVDNQLIGNVAAPNTGGWQNWQYVTLNTNLGVGKHKLKIDIKSAGFNLNYMVLNDGTLTLSSKEKFTMEPTSIIPNLLRKGKPFRIQFKNNEMSGKRVNVKIVSVLGAEIHSSQHEVTKNADILVNSNINQLESGNYFIKISGDGFYSTGKMVLTN